MISSFEVVQKQLSVHRIGNKSQNEYYSLSDEPLQINDQQLQNLLTHYFLYPFEKANEVFRFIHSSDDLELNELYHFSKQMFANPSIFHEISGNITKHLYDISNHPKIKSGELYIAHFENLQLEGEKLQAIGIFKSETKETFLKVYPDKGGFNVSYEEEGINIQKLDKGCLIFNAEAEEGYKVIVIDQTNRSDAAYWKDEFLGLRVRNDNFTKTSNSIALCKEFINDKLDSEFDISKADKLDLLNRSSKYFKEKDIFDIDEFSDEVIGNTKASESFKKFADTHNEEFESMLNQPFDISAAAVKKQAKLFKSVLKLDKNFHVYIHGNKELIEKGFDDERGMSFYKIFFKEEN